MTIGLLFLALAFICFVLLWQNSKIVPITSLYFKDISQNKRSKAYKLLDSSYNLEDWALKQNIKMGNSKVWSRVVLTVDNNNVTIEDKNFRNYCFRNGRRIRKSLLQDGDIVDIEKYTFMFLSPVKKRLKRIKNFDSIHANAVEPIVNYPILQPVDEKQKMFIIDKNMVYIGRSLSNDLLIRSPQVSSRQAVIKMVNNRARLTILSADNNVYVNGKKTDEVYLKNRDEVSFGNIKYRYFSKQPGFES